MFSQAGAAGAGSKSPPISSPPISSSPISSNADITFEQIRERAYDLWERHHRPDGFSIELWLLAERELKAEREARMARAREAPREPGPAGSGGSAP